VCACRNKEAVWGAGLICTSSENRGGPAFPTEGSCGWPTVCVRHARVLAVLGALVVRGSRIRGGHQRRKGAIAMPNGRYFLSHHDAHASRTLAGARTLWHGSNARTVGAHTGRVFAKGDGHLCIFDAKRKDLSGGVKCLGQSAATVAPLVRNVSSQTAAVPRFRARCAADVSFAASSVWHAS